MAVSNSSIWYCSLALRMKGSLERTKVLYATFGKMSHHSITFCLFLCRFCDYSYVHEIVALFLQFIGHSILHSNKIANVFSFTCDWLFDLMFFLVFRTRHGSAEFSLFTNVTSFIRATRSKSSRCRCVLLTIMFRGSMYL